VGWPECVEEPGHEADAGVGGAAQDAGDLRGVQFHRAGERVVGVVVVVCAEAGEVVCVECEAGHAGECMHASCVRAIILLVCRNLRVRYYSDVIPLIRALAWTQGAAGTKVSCVHAIRGQVGATKMGRAIMLRSPETWVEYVARVTGYASRQKVAELAGIDPSSVSRWHKDGKPSPESVVTLARAVGVPPVEALAACGFIDAREAAAVIEVTQSRSELSDCELLTELGERLAERVPRRQDDDITGRLAPPDDLAEGVEDDG